MLCGTTLRDSSTGLVLGVFLNGHQFESPQDHLLKVKPYDYRNIRANRVLRVLNTQDYKKKNVVWDIKLNVKTLCCPIIVGLHLNNSLDFYFIFLFFNT